MNVGSSKDLNKWHWLAYPLGAGAFIFFSLNFLINNPQRLERFTNQQEQIEIQEQKADQLREKLRILKQVDVEAEKKRLEELVEAMPTGKRVWLLVGELQIAATESGSILEKYDGKIGDVRDASESGVEADELATIGIDPNKMQLEATFQVPNLESLKVLMTKLEKFMPLVKVSAIEYDAGELVVTVEGGWAPGVKVVTEAQNPVPAYTASLNAALAKLENLEGLPRVEVSTDSGEFVTNPF